MNLYKTAIFENWTYNTPKGILNPQQLCKLPLEILDTIAIELNEQFKRSKKKSFLNNEPDEQAKLALDLILDIMETKQNQIKINQQAKANASYNEKIDKIIATKQEDNLQSLSLEELQALKK